MEKMTSTLTWPLETGSRYLIRTRVGKMTMTGLLKLIHLSENVLDYISPEKSSRITFTPSKIITRAKAKKQGQGQGDCKVEGQGDSEEVDTECKGQGDAKDTKIKETRMSVSFQVENSGPGDGAGIVMVVGHYLVIKPLRAWIWILKRLHHWFRNKSRQGTQEPLTPEVKAEIRSRIKASPRRQRRSVPRQIVSFALSLFSKKKGAKYNAGDIRRYLVAENDTDPTKKDCSKRKYSEVTEETDEDNPFEVDLDSYVSDEDPDYQVPEYPPEEDSLEYRSDNSDDSGNEKEEDEYLLVTEETPPATKVTVPSIEKAAEIPLPDSPAISLKPAWQRLNKEDINKNTTK